MSNIFTAESYPISSAQVEALSKEELLAQQKIWEAKKQDCTVKLEILSGNIAKEKDALRDLNLGLQQHKEKLTFFQKKLSAINLKLKDLSEAEQKTQKLLTAAAQETVLARALNEQAYRIESKKIQESGGR